MPTTTMPTAFTSINYYYFNGKYYSTLANVNINGPSLCQNTYYYLPFDWILAPDNSDSIGVIFSNTWSTSTVVVASGVGYYSRSSYASINRAYSYWLYTSYSTYYGNSYNCKMCDCQILIMYSPYPKTLKPSYSPVVYSTTTSKNSSSSSSSGVYSVLVIPFFIMVGCLIFFIHRRRVSAMQMQQVQVQPVPQMMNSAGYYEQPTITNSNYGIVAQTQPMVYGSNMQQLQPQQPGIHTQPEYIQLQPQQAIQLQGYGYVQSHPEPQSYGQPQAQGYGYGQIYPEPQVQQVYTYGNSPPLQLQHQVERYSILGINFYFRSDYLISIVYPQGGNSLALPQAQQLSSGVDYYAQPQPYSPAVVYPAVDARSMYGDHGHVFPANNQHPSSLDAPIYPKT